MLKRDMPLLQRDQLIHVFCQYDFLALITNQLKSLPHYTRPRDPDYTRPRDPHYT